MAEYDDHDMESAERRGVEKGREELRLKINSWLQQKYMQKGVDRTTPEGKAILALTRELNRALNEGVL